MSLQFCERAPVCLFFTTSVLSFEPSESDHRNESWCYIMTESPSVSDFSLYTSRHSVQGVIQPPLFTLRPVKMEHSTPLLNFELSVFRAHGTPKQVTEGVR